MHRTKRRYLETSLNIPTHSATHFQRKHHKVRLKHPTGHTVCLLILSPLIILLVLVNNAQANRPPRFIIEGQSEIVLRLKESPETEVGKSENSHFEGRLQQM